MCVIVIQESTINNKMWSSECYYSSTGLVHSGICGNHCCLRFMMPCDVTTQQRTKVRIQLRIISHIISIYSFSVFPGHSNGTSKSNNIGGKNGSSRFYAAHIWNILHSHTQNKAKESLLHYRAPAVQGMAILYGDGCISGGCSTHTWIHFSCNTKSPFLSQTTFSMVCDMDEFSYHSLSRYV